MRCSHLLILIATSSAVGTALPAQEREMPIFGDPRFPLATITEMVGPSRYRILPPPFADRDPVAPLAEGDAAIIAGKFDAKASNAFVDRYVDRIAATYSSVTSATLTAWLDQHPAIRRDFYLAISPYYDDVPAACAILDTLLQADAAKLERYAQLAIALAIVHDTPAALLSSRYTAIWGIEEPQFTALPSYAELWQYFTDPRQQGLFPFKPDQMSWSMMVHLVDLDSDATQREWVKKTQTAYRTDIAALYPAVPYDNLKLATLKQTQLGTTLPYSLENILNKGGVCGDQGHFCSRVAKTFGIPAMKCTGSGRFGGMGHAWAGYLTAKGGRPVLEFTGRYFFDNYYTGDVFDPQTRTETLDRYVALSYDGASLSFPKMQEATCLARAAKACIDSDPESSVILAQTAIERNTYCADGWRVLMTLIGMGKVERKEAAKWGSRMLKDLRAHPDLTIEGIDRYLHSIPMDEQVERQRLWNGAYQLYKDRPDLQIALRMAQCAELVATNQEPEALKRALETVVPNAKEGTLILPLVEFVVHATKEFQAKETKFRPDVVRNALALADKEFPKQRGNEASPAYAEFRQLVSQL